MRHPGGIFDLVFELGVFDHALEQARAGHQNVVVLFLAQLVGTCGPRRRPFADRRSRYAVRFSLTKMRTGIIQAVSAVQLLRGN
jgi:hypothetical protein